METKIEKLGCLESALAVAELMEQYNTHRARWIAAKGNDYGFDAWFTCQVLGK